MKQGSEIIVIKTLVEQIYYPVMIISAKDGLEVSFRIYDILPIMKNMYQYDIHLNEIHKVFDTHGSREFFWVYHDDKYGNGKTTLDKLLCNNEGYQVISLSPWHANYDEDILLLIYERVREFSKKKSYKLLNVLNVFLCMVIVISLSNFISIIESVKNIFNLCGLNDIFLIIIIVVSGLIVFICYKYLAQIIKHFNNSSRLYQDYFIYQILKMMEDNAIMLVIEDIDRMSYEGYHNVLRVCSCLNSYCTFSNRILGIISFSSESIIDIERANLCANNYPSKYIRKKARDNFNCLRDKVFKREILANYRSKDSKAMYLRKVCCFAYDIFNKEYINMNCKLEILRKNRVLESGETQNYEYYYKIIEIKLSVMKEKLKILNCLKENSFKKIKCNFRDIHNLLDVLIYNEEISIQEIQKVKKLLKVMFDITIE